MAKKTVLMPILAGAGFLITLVVVQLSGSTNEQLITSVENGAVPALQLAMRLQDDLLHVQRALQDAVAAGHGKLETADAVRDRFITDVRSGRANAALNPAQLQLLEDHFQQYYTLARRTSEQADRQPSLDEMTAMYNTTHKRLDDYELQQKQLLTDSFAAVRLNNVRSKVAMATVLVISLALLIFVSVVVIRSITAPIARAVETANRLAAGDLTGDIEVTSGDELGMLLRAMQGMLSSLRSMIGGLRGAAVRVSQSAGGISGASLQIAKGAQSQSTASDEASSTMVEMASQIENVARSTQTLASTVDETSSAIHELGSSIEQVARNAGELLASAEQTSHTVAAMAASIAGVAEKVESVDATSREAAGVAQSGSQQITDVINGIDKNARDVGRIVSVISDIADQTNLLALNAAIEAARAGDAGRGFAVVADEIRRLAERSVKSTREIGDFVSRVKKDTEHAVTLSRSVLQQITDSVASTTTLIGEVRQSTREQRAGASEVLTTAENMRSIAGIVAMASREQARGASEMMKAVEAMNQMTQQVAHTTSEQKRGGDLIVRTIEQIASVAQQNVDATHSLASETESLAREAASLQSLAESFSGEAAA
jgi:methyl-accepting chemotaxis protein